MISLDKLTVKSQEALQDAVRLASERGHAEVETEHLLCAFLRQEGGVMGELLARTGVSPQRLLSEAEGLLAALPKVSGAVTRGLSHASSRCSGAPSPRRTRSRTSSSPPSTSSSPSHRSPGRWPTSCGNSV